MHKCDCCNNQINQKPKTDPKPVQKNSKLSLIHRPSKVPQKYPPAMQILVQLCSQCIPFSQQQICSWAAACRLPIGQRAHSGRIHNVIVLGSPSHILICNNTLLIIGQETKSTVWNDFKESLLSANPPLKLPWELWEAYFHCQEASWIRVPYLSIIISFHHDVVDHILGWRWEDVMHWKVAVATKHRCQGARSAFGLLDMINNAEKCWAV